MIEHNLATWIQFPRRKQKGIARRLRVPPVRGLSAKVGEALALDMSDPSLSDIAKSMYANIRGQRESGSRGYIGQGDGLPEAYERTENVA